MAAKKKQADGSSSSDKPAAVAKHAKHAKGKTPVKDLQTALAKGDHEPVTFGALAHILDAHDGSASDDATGSSSSSAAQ